LSGQNCTSICIDFIDSFNFAIHVDYIYFGVRQTLEMSPFSCLQG
jgi:hypothetical protein